MFDQVAAPLFRRGKGRFFPRTGSYGRHCGMIVGEEHSDRRTMAAFLARLPLIAPRIDVILLEYFVQGTSPQGCTVDAIRQELRRQQKAFETLDLTAQQVHQLCRQAEGQRLEVRGMDQPPPDGMRGWDYFQWRTGKQCNQAFLDSVDRFADSRGLKRARFCLYVGAAHIRMLKQLAPLVPAYVFVDDFVEVGPDGRSLEGAVVV